MQTLLGNYKRLGRRLSRRPRIPDNYLRPATRHLPLATLADLMVHREEVTQHYAQPVLKQSRVHLTHRVSPATSLHRPIPLPPEHARLYCAEEGKSLLSVLALVDYLASREVDLTAFQEAPLAIDLMENLLSEMADLEPFRYSYELEVVLQWASEEIYSGGALADRREPLSLPFPFIHWDDEQSMAFHAFMSGPDNVASLVNELLASDEVQGEMPESLQSFYAGADLRKLMRRYARHPNSAIPLRKLSKAGNAYFGPVFRKYRWLVDIDPALIGESPSCLEITRLEHLQAYEAWARAWNSAWEALPSLYDLMENQNGTAVAFLTEIMDCVTGNKETTDDTAECNAV